LPEGTYLKFWSKIDGKTFFMQSCPLAGKVIAYTLRLLLHGGL
jgi:hypothetical protein